MIALASAVISLTLAGAAMGQPPSSAASPSSAPAPVYQVKGFRSAHFGMSEAQVRSAIAADLPGAQVTESANPAERTRALQAKVAHLEPGPGTATITYIFGATSRTLSHVNVIWILEGDPRPDERASVVAAAAQLTNYFKTLPTAPKSSMGVTPSGPNGLIMFAALDEKGAAVEVAVEGIGYQATTGGKTSAVAPPSGPAMLRVSYIANAANPDIYRVQAGAF
jgi:hypothetical protein